MPKNSFYSFYFLILLLKNFEISNPEEIPYSATISPPGYYQIAIWDTVKAVEKGHYCIDLFEKINIEGKDKSTYEQLYFKYFPGIEVGHFHECFSNFYFVQTNENGKFEVSISKTMPAKIYFQLFPVIPIDGQMELIESDSLSGITLQSKQSKTGWKKPNANELVRQFSFHKSAERNLIIAKMLDSWQNNEKPSLEQSFFIKAYFKQISIKISEILLIVGGRLKKDEMNIFANYGFKMQKWQNEGVLKKKLAQIDEMPKLVRFFCTFFTGHIDADKLIDALLHSGWSTVCNTQIGQKKHGKSILEKFNLEN